VRVTHRSLFGWLLLATLAFAADPGAAANDLRSFCDGCVLHIGVGATYHFWSSTGGVVVPITLTTPDDRYEFGIFRMSTKQSFYDTREQVQKVTARPYWGASASRRWSLVQGSSWHVYFGFGVSYKTESDDLSVTHWNFASQLGARIVLPQSGSSFEVTVRHWSNAGIRLPNRGQDFFTMSYTFEPARGP
jgi:hypothetical protein